MLDKLTDSMQFSAETLKLRARRQEVLTSNISNVDTPNYKAVDFKFSDALRAATGDQLGQDSTALLLTNNRHLSGNGAALGMSTAEMLLYRRGNATSIDGNSVDIDKERSAFAENTVKYEAALRSINGRISTLKQAMGSGNQ
jgi:flagellar basal-body rod protein FlgB